MRRPEGLRTREEVVVGDRLFAAKLSGSSDGAAERYGEERWG